MHKLLLMLIILGCVIMTLAAPKAVYAYRSRKPPCTCWSVFLEFLRDIGIVFQHLCLNFINLTSGWVELMPCCIQKHCKGISIAFRTCKSYLEFGNAVVKESAFLVYSMVLATANSITYIFSVLFQGISCIYHSIISTPYYFARQVVGTLFFIQMLFGEAFKVIGTFIMDTGEGIRKTGVVISGMKYCFK